MLLEYTLLFLTVLVVGLLVFAWLLWRRLDEQSARDAEELEVRFDEMIEAVLTGQRAERHELQEQLQNVDRNSRQSFTNLMAFVTDQQGKNAAEVKSLTSVAQKNLSELNAILHQRLLELQALVDERFQRVTASHALAERQLQEQLQTKINEMRQELDGSLERIRTLNERKLEEMRATVQEKLDHTLNERLSVSFRMVDEKLGLVQHGLGEMRSMAASVRDLKGVLTNVKTRGTFGETQLSLLLADLLTPAQYEEQFALIPGCNTVVDFAIRLPGNSSEEPCWLPIDSKFPVEDYERLLAAVQASDAALEREAQKALERTILIQARSIHEKYVQPPTTTEFAIMYLPSEGLYAEVLRIPGLFERLQRELRITPAGPTVISALINSLQLGFVTLALQERSSEVWKVLGDVKSEFIRFAESFAKVQKKFSEAQSSLDAMQTRHSVMQKTMASIDVGLPDVALSTEHQALSDASASATNESAHAVLPEPAQGVVQAMDECSPAA